MAMNLLSAVVVPSVPLAPSSSTACVDSDTQCRYWAHSRNECTTNADWMDLHCPAACGACLGQCEDQHPTCAAFALEGECDANPRFMVEKCPASCDLCPRLDGAALQCDACIAIQESIWRSLQPINEPNREWLSHADVRRAVSDACVSHEWVSLGTRYQYHAACEATVASRFMSLEVAWLNATRVQEKDDATTAPAASKRYRVPSQSVGLRLKRELCLSGSGVDNADDTTSCLGRCNEQRGRTLLGMGAPPLTSSRSSSSSGGGEDEKKADLCSACHTYVEDAVALLRRSGKLVRPSDQPESVEHRTKLSMLHGLCADLALRHNVSQSDGDAVAARCEALVQGHFEQLSALTYQWARPDVVHLACVATLGVCDEAAGAHEEL